MLFAFQYLSYIKEEMRYILDNQPAKNTNNSESTKSCFLRFNGDSSSLYSYTWIDGNGSSASSNRDSGAGRAYYGEIVNSYNVNASNFSQFNININNYRN
jgi:hypothetical protein